MRKSAQKLRQRADSPVSAFATQAGDWASIQETLYLQSVPGMRESTREGLAAPIEECGKALSW